MNNLAESVDSTCERYIQITFLAVLSLITLGCTDVFSKLDNPTDPDSIAYQGFDTVTDVEDVRPNTSDYGESIFVPTLIATRVLGAEAYSFQIAASADFATPLFTSADSVSNVFIPCEWTEFTSSITYYWRVQAMKDDVWGEWSAPCMFTITAFVIGTLSPINGGTTTSTTPLLDWNDVIDASSYEVQIAATTDGVDGVPISVVSDSEYQVSMALAFGDVRYWRVRAKNVDNVWSAWSNAWYFDIAYSIGANGPAGGVVFHDKGSVSDGWRYLEAAPGDQSIGIVWWSGIRIDMSITAIGVGSGETNTAAIIVAQGAGSYAASVCANLSLGGYNDWFLPSRDELNLMYTNLKQASLGGFSNALFWSSSQTNYLIGINGDHAWYQDFSNGENNGSYKTNSYSIRACRAF